MISTVLAEFLGLRVVLVEAVDDSI